MPSAAPNTVSLPDGVEIFRAGRHTDDEGNVHEFTEADVRRTAAVYDPAKREAPLTVGHPEHNLPAYGWVKSLSVNEAGRLVMSTHQVLPQFAEMVRGGSFKKRSTSFYPPDHPNNPTPGAWYPRHVAFLGAQPPAIHGLADINFSEGEAKGLVQFSEATPPNPNPSQEQTAMNEDELKQKLADSEKATADERAAREKAERERDEANGRATNFAEQQRKDRNARFTSFAEAQVKEGRLLPADQPMVVATLEVLADAKPVSFSEGNTTRSESPSEWLQKLISNATPVVSFGEFAPGRVGADLGAGSAKGKSDAEIDKAAQEYARKNKVSYAEAARAVTAFTTAT